jgi:hypothetical protein
MVAGSKMLYGLHTAVSLGPISTPFLFVQIKLSILCFKYHCSWFYKGLSYKKYFCVKEAHVLK